MPRRPAAFHPLLVSAYPILYLYGLNAGKIPVTEIVLPLTIAWAVVGAIWFIAARLSRDVKFGALVATACAGLFFVAMPAFRILTGAGLSRPIAMTLLAGSIAAGAILLTWKRKYFGWVSTFLDVTTAAAVAMLLATAVPKAIRTGDRPVPPQSLAFDLRPGSPRPNIYYIVLDGYGRTDVLRDMYGFDNTPYLKRLEELGFYVAPESVSNYNQTLLSIASAINFTYLDELARRVGASSDDRTFLRDLIFHNEVASRLKELGYGVATFSTGFWGTDRIEHADVRLSGHSGLTEFQNILLGITPVPAVLASLPVEHLRHWQFDAHRSTIGYIFDELPRVPLQSGPKFVFAHILAPHPPFVFNARGGPVNPDHGFTLDDGDLSRSRRPAYIRSYAQQAEFIIARVTDVAARIVEADPGAVIIIQGDHGPRGHLNWSNYDRTNMWETLSILNAYRVPPHVRAQLYPHISPVNTFRVVFNGLFGTKLPLLKDEAYFALWASPYEFRRVTEDVQRQRPGAERASNVRAKGDRPLGRR